MAVIPEQPASPVVANLTVLAGFALIFASFTQGLGVLWILGLGLVLAGGLWAGFSGQRGEPTDGGAG